MNTDVGVVTKSENLFCMYKLGSATPFNKAFIECCFLAGNSDFEKLKITFPLARVVWDYKYVPNYWKDLVKRWNAVPNRHTLHRLRA